MSSITASASSRIRHDAGTRLPSNVNTPTANAMSVAIGIAHPAAPPRPALSATKIAAGTNIPPSAAANGSAARRRPASSPIAAEVSRGMYSKKT
jgi:hypothetical protein